MHFVILHSILHYQGYMGHNSKGDETNEGWKHLELSLVDLDTLLNVTNNFSSDNKLRDIRFRPIRKVRVYPTTTYKFLRSYQYSQSSYYLNEATFRYMP